MNTSTQSHKMCYRHYFNITFLTLALFGLIACESPAYISGQIDGRDEKEYTVYLIEPQTLLEVGASYFGEVLDSAVVQGDGSFEFKNIPELTDGELIELVIQPVGKYPTFLEVENPLKSNYMPIFWSSGQWIEISAVADEFQRSFSIYEPSEMNQALLNLRDIHQEAFQKHIAGKDWDLEEGIGLLERENAQLLYQQALMHFAEQTDYFLPAMVALRWVSPEGIYERIPEFLVDQCAKWEDFNHDWTHELCELASPEDLPVLIGDQFPNVHLPMEDGDTLAIYELMGERLTIIDLWASWCAPCRMENRKVLAPLWARYHEQGLQIIGYGLESDRNAWIAAIARDGADRWYHASELQGDDSEFLRALRVQTIPANFILDSQGQVIAKNLHGDELIDFVKGYLGEN